MKFNPNRHHRVSLRLANFDYSTPGAYFITICTVQRQHLFGEIAGAHMRRSGWGEIAYDCWMAIPNHFPQTQLDAFIIMPDHLHGIILITDNTTAGARIMDSTTAGARHAVPLRWSEQFGKPVTGSIPTIIRSYKSAVARQINLDRGTPGARVWQRNYHERIIRNAIHLSRIRYYIEMNPISSAEDRGFRDGESRLPVLIRPTQRKASL